MAQFIVHSPQVERQYNSALRVGGIDTILSNAKKGPMGQMAETQASWDNFQQEVGKPMLEMMTNLGEQVRPFIDLIGHNPELAKFTGELVIGSKALLGMKDTFLALKSAGLMNDLFKIRGLPEAEEGVSKLGGEIGSIPRSLQVGVAVLGVADAIYNLKQMYDEYKKTKQAWAEAEDSYNTNDETFKQNKARMLAAGGAPSQVFDNEAQRALLQLRGERSDLGRYLQHPMGDYWVKTFFLDTWLMKGDSAPFASGMFGNGDPVGTFRRRAGALGDSDVMGAFIGLERSRFAPDEQKTLEGLLEAAFPESFKTATDRIKESEEDAAKAAADLKSQGIDPLTSKTSDFGDELHGATRDLGKFRSGIYGCDRLRRIWRKRSRVRKNRQRMLSHKVMQADPGQRQTVLALAGQ